MFPSFSLDFDNDKLVTPTPTRAINMDLFGIDDEEVIVEEDSKTRLDLESGWFGIKQTTITPHNMILSSNSLNDSTFGITSELKTKCSLTDENEIPKSNMQKRKRNFANDDREPLRNISNNYSSSSSCDMAPKTKKKKIVAIDLDDRRAGKRTLYVSNEPSHYHSIEAALANALPYDTIQVSPGIHKVSSTITVNVEGVHITGENPANVKIICTQPVPLMSVVENYVTLSNLAFYHDCSSEIDPATSSRNTGLLEVDGPRVENSFQTQILNCYIMSSVEHGLYLTGFAEPIIANCSIMDCTKIGILFCKNASGIIKNNKILRNNYEGVTCRGKSHPILKNNDISDGKSGGIFIRDNSHPHIISNIISNNKRSGIFVSHKAKPFISRNEIHNCKENGIVLKMDAGGKIEENDIYQNAYPNVYITEDSDAEIVNNKIRDGLSFGIWAKGKCSSEIKNNSIYDNFGKNVLVSEFAKPSFHSNTIYFTGTKKQNEELRGIVLKDLCKPIFEYDHIYGHTSSGVDVGGRAGPILCSCDIHDNTKNGILVRGYASATVKDCSIYQNNNPNILSVDTSEAKIENCKVYNGKQTGISAKGNGTLKLQDTEIYSNQFTNIKLGGSSTATIFGCKISSGRQSGIWVKDDSRGSIDRCTFSGNRRENILMEISGNMNIGSHNVYDK
ncbi:predicted protein [Naegleria gruberi]|uniref:Predicted protein n=1 Tax=Naegleria gruberi TaxID=5762 RepID=D2VHR8_NAEGR|nr:uncharacterized protein NAEGRDRAFT_68422 [Naegleria gruberi]EFC43721.1 predicted protein [Naegleria gruberi]|eukprot:XP_002676465.1 predicted protein [Naegleria gruberi strain NEG-M]